VPKLIRFFLTAVLLHNLTSYAAPVAPDAGQTLRELQQLPDLDPPQTNPPLQLDQKLHIEESVPDKAKVNMTDGIRFMVNKFRISGNNEIPTGELDALLTELTGIEHNLSELNVAAARITSYYRTRGYTVARAYLPAQDIINGEVSVNIIEGHIANHRIDNRARLSDKSIGNFLGQIESGDVVRTAKINRTLLLLNDTPGVGGARASLQPGASVGTSDLVVELKPGPAYSGDINLDNYGNRYIGTYRLGGTLNLNSPFKIGDQINLNAMTSDQRLAYGRAAYQLPISGSGLRLGAAYSSTRYRLGKEFTVLTAHGKARSGTTFAYYPFIRSLTGNLTGLFAWEQKRLADYVDATSTITDKHARLASLGLSGNRRDTLGGDSISSFDLSLVRGNLTIDSPTALAIDNSTARSNGTFTRLFYNANRQQHLPKSSQLFFSVSGQQASKNLDSSEKFSLGGANGVRAYPQGEGIGDEGYVATLELRHSVSDTLQGMLFYDTGSITINRNPYLTSVPNSLSLSGAGVGVIGNLAGTQIKMSIAWRTDGGQPASIPASAVRSSTVWIKASEQF
jgi:hemolysin activation/secretion protein